MKNLFSFKLYFQGLRKIRTAGAAMAIVITVLNAVFPILAGMGRKDIGAIDVVPEIDTILFAPCGWLLVLFAPLLVYNMFSYLNERRSADFFHALPQKRACVYISFMFAIFTWILGVLGLTALVNAILWRTLTYYALNAGAVAMTFFGFLILALAMSGFMALSMTLTGTATANWLVFLLFSLFIRICGIFFLNGFQSMVPMFSPDHSWLRIFDWKFFLPISLLLNLLQYNFGLQYPLEEQCWTFVYWFAVAVVLWTVSAVAYCRRRSESATKSAPNRLMQHIYRIGVTLPFLLYGAYDLIFGRKYLYPYHGRSGSGSLLILIGFLVWVIFELLTTKKVKNGLKTLPLFLLTAILAAGGIGSLYAAKGIFYATTPKRDAIKGATVDVSFHSSLSAWETVLFSEVEITDPEILDQVYEALEETKVYWQTPLEEREDIYKDSLYTDKVDHPYFNKVTLTLRSGRKVTYNFSSSYDIFKIFDESEEYRARRLNALDFDLESVHCNYASGNDMHIWEAFKADFEALDDEQKLKYLQWNEGRTGAIRVRGVYEKQHFVEYFSVNKEYMPNAYLLYIKCYLENQADSLEDLRSAADRIAEESFENAVYVRMRINKANGVNGANGGIDCYKPELINAFLQSLVIDSHLLDAQKAAKQEIYRFELSVIWMENKHELEGGLPDEDAYKYNDSVNISMYLTFSDDDIALYRQLIASGGTMPIS